MRSEFGSEKLEFGSLALWGVCLGVESQQIYRIFI